MVNWLVKVKASRGRSCLPKAQMRQFLALCVAVVGIDSS